MRAAVSLFAIVATMATAISGCGGDNSAEKSKEGRTKVMVGVIPIADVAPLYLGVKKGFFKAEGLDVEAKPIQGGAAAIPAVVANEIQFAFGNAISDLQAQQRGISCGSSPRACREAGRTRTRPTRSL